MLGHPVFYYLSYRCMKTIFKFKKILYIPIGMYINVISEIVQNKNNSFSNLTVEESLVSSAV